MSEKKSGNARKISSYEKGIQKLLENREIFEWIIATYIVETHNKYRSNVFPTTQIAKVLMKKLEKKKTQYPILHKVVRKIFELWALDPEFCVLIHESSESSKKLKMVYKISDYGIRVLKSRIINFNIQSISGDIDEHPGLTGQSREEYVMQYYYKIMDDLEEEFDNDLEDELDDDLEDGLEED